MLARKKNQILMGIKPTTVIIIIIIMVMVIVIIIIIIILDIIILDILTFATTGIRNIWGKKGEFG